MENPRDDIPKEVKIKVNLPSRSDGDIHAVSVGSVLRTLAAHSKFIIRFIMVCFVLSVLAALAYYIKVPSSAGSVSALISYGYAQAETGMDPAGNTLDPNVVRSPYIIDKAIDQLNLYSTGITVEDVRSNITMQGVVPDDVLERILVIKQIATTDPSKLEDLSQIDYHPTQYIISLNEGGSLKALSPSDAVDLLNEICSQYQQYFIQQYGTTQSLDTVIQNFDQTNYDYFEVVQILRGQVNTMLTYCNTMQTSAGDFCSPTTNMTFTDIAASIGLINDVDITRLNALIFANALTRDKDLSVKIYEYDVMQKEAELARITADADNSERLADKFEKDYWMMYNSVDNFDVFRQASNTYDGFMISAQQYGETAAQLTEDISLYNNFLDAINSDTSTASPSDIAFVESEIPSLVSTLQSWITKIHDTTDDYVKLDLFKDAVKVVTPAKFYSVLSTYQKKMLYIIAIGSGCGVFLAIFIALGRDAMKPPTKRKPLKRNHKGATPHKERLLNEDDLLL